jgi:energy-coupling factor transporter transmembrane protein EcfT
MQLSHKIFLPDRGLKMGTYGYLAVFLWLLGVVMAFPQEKLPITATVCFVVILAVFPSVFRRVLSFRFIFFGLILMIPPIFLMGEADHSFWGVSYSGEGLLIGLHAGVRFFVVLLAVHGFTRSVDIPSLAGILERFGLQGLGFSIGVALNLVPSLKEAGIKSWHSLKMRGGFRKQWLRGIQLYFVVVISNALRQAEEIALAAESRGFSPEKSRPMAVNKSKADWLVCPVCLVTFVLALI